MNATIVYCLYELSLNETSAEDTTEGQEGGSTEEQSGGHVEGSVGLSSDSGTALLNLNTENTIKEETTEEEEEGGSTEEVPRLGLTTESDTALLNLSLSGDPDQNEVYNAKECVSKCEPCVGIVAKDGVVIVTARKLTSQLVERNSVFQKITQVSDNMGMVFSGLEADYRQLTRNALKIGAIYLVMEERKIPVEVLPQLLGPYLQLFTQASQVRAFGVELLIAGHEERSHLYKMDCTGSFESVRACAIGRNAETCNTYLERYMTEDILLKDAIRLAIDTLKLGCDDNSMRAIQMSVAICDSEGFKRKTDDEVRRILGYLR